MMLDADPELRQLVNEAAGMCQEIEAIVDLLADSWAKPERRAAAIQRLGEDVVNTAIARALVCVNGLLLLRRSAELRARMTTPARQN